MYGKLSQAEKHDVKGRAQKQLCGEGRKLSSLEKAYLEKACVSQFSEELTPDQRHH